MGQFITLLIVLGSLGGIAFILHRKIPSLLELPQERAEETKQSLVSLVKAAAQEKVLDKTLAQARTLAAKAEAQTAEWLEKLRKKSKERKKEFEESYGEQLHKKSQDTEKPPG